MKPRVLFIITSDPRQSPRPAEAIRIAAGISVGGKADVTVYLHGPAVLALNEGPVDLLDEENYRQYLPLIIESGSLIHAQHDAPLLATISESPTPHKAMNLSQLATEASLSHSVLRF